MYKTNKETNKETNKQIHLTNFPLFFIHVYILRSKNICSITVHVHVLRPVHVDYKKAYY